VSTGVDEFALWDAAYVLGALSPLERRQFEEHLALCAECRAAVADLAGIPGLLSQVSAEDVVGNTPLEVLAGEPESLPVPPSDLVARLVARERRHRYRWRAAVAAAVVMVIVGAGIATGLVPLPAGGPRRLAFSPVAPSAITAVVDLVPLRAGTDVEVECQYGEEGEPDPGGAHAQYSIVVVDRLGRATEIKQWPAKPDKVMRPRATTPLSLSQISRVEIRQTATDQILLRASLH
jgi:hypothetical protein